MSEAVAAVRLDASCSSTRRVCAACGASGGCSCAALGIEAVSLFARRCEWCEGPIRSRARRDAKFCSTRCRQASHRFTTAGRARAAVAHGHPLRLAYADPPYPGKAHLYRGHPDFAGEVDPDALLEVLCDGSFDGWALSTSSAALPTVLASCPPAARVAAWFRGERPTASYHPLPAWEPVIYWGGRAYLSPVDERRIDALVHVARPRTTDPRRVIGAKPAAFCWWLFDLLGALPGDELVDLYPGSGGVARAWRYASLGDEHDAYLEGDTTRHDVGHDESSRSDRPTRRPDLHDASLDREPTRRGQLSDESPAPSCVAPSSGTAQRNLRAGFPS